MVEFNFWLKIYIIIIDCLTIMTNSTGNGTRRCSTAWQLTLNNHGNCLHFKKLTLAGPVKCQYYYMRTAEINCHYLTILVCGTQFKCASVVGQFQAFWPLKGLVNLGVLTTTGIKPQSTISADNVSDWLDTVGGIDFVLTSWLISTPRPPW